MGKRVAVVGSGLAGLATAHMLRHGGCDVELFEKADSVGMDAASLTVDGVRIDVPFRVVTPDYYPCLVRLYQHLGIGLKAADYSLGFTADGCGGGTSPLWSYTNAGQVPIPDEVSFGGERLALTRDWVRLVYACMRIVRRPVLLRPDGALAILTIGQYLRIHRYSRAFSDRVFLPFIASLLTCSLGAAADYPATTVLHLVAKVACGTHLRRAQNGVREVCDALTRTLSTVHLSTTISEIVLSEPGDRAEAPVLLRTDDGREYRFDHVVLATPADTAVRLLRTVQAANYPPPELDAALRSVPYEDAVVVTHRDTAAMPARRGDWRGVNIRSKPTADRVMGTLWINYVERGSSPQKTQLQSNVFQTVDPLVELDRSKIIGESRFRRSLVTLDSQVRIDDVHRFQGVRNIWFVGAYVAPGVPLLEGCVRSAVDVARALVATGCLPFDAPRLLRSAPGRPRYEVGLAPAMKRGEAVAAYFECEAARPFACHTLLPTATGLLRRLRTYAMWAAFTVLLPVLFAVLDAVDAVSRALLGPDLAHRLQTAALDGVVFAVCLTLAAYKHLHRYFQRSDAKLNGS
ncbi:hypothetical protein GGF46_002744 [Coemansia sp. RSA 552]|nr:hypothetical protein GGF46_002744 [Coemansia sp. RSA 552]